MERPHKDHIFGSLSGKSWIGRGERVAGAGADERRVVPKFELKTRIGDEKEDAKVRAFLRGEVLADGKPSKGFLVDEGVGEGFGDGEGLFLQSWVVNQDSGYGWTAEQVGFLLLLLFPVQWFGLTWVVADNVDRSGASRISTASAVIPVVLPLLPRVGSTSWLVLFTTSSALVLEWFSLDPPVLLFVLAWRLVTLYLFSCCMLLISVNHEETN